MFRTWGAGILGRLKAWMVGAGALALLGLGAFAVQRQASERNVAARIAAVSSGLQPPSLLAEATATDTAHYRIHSTAAAAQTAQVAQAVESLYARYAQVFPPPRTPATRLTLVLYRDRAEFKRNNRSRPWAEAYYLPPRCYAYFDATRPNPYHWMLHEATHQLAREVSGFQRMKWVDEGLASYFGASRLVAGELVLGDADPQAYPIWWLSQQALTGVLEQDIASGQIIPLEQLIGGRGGPDENRHFNQYYIHYWSLTHFFFHYRGGIYAERYRQLVAAGGTPEHFKRLIGPPARIQREWYGYLLRIVAHAKASAAVPVERGAQSR